MSYSFDGVNDRLTGSFTSTYAQPITIGVFLKVTAHPIAIQTALALGNSSSSANDSIGIGTNSADDTWRARSTDSAAAGSSAITAAFNVDGVWAGEVGVFTSDTLRDVYIQTISQTDQNTASRVVAGVLQFIQAGENNASAQDFNGKLAELAIWKVALSSGDITSYLAGTAASTINAANLIGYWPLSANSSTHTNLGTDAGGLLTVTAAVFDSDHPVITGGGSANSRMLLMGVG